METHSRQRQFALQEIAESEHSAILVLNDAEVTNTSAMDLTRLRHLLSLSAYKKIATVDGDVVAFMFAMRESAAYQNENFEWFAARYKRFLYIDRIVVSAQFAGIGIGKAMYQDLIAQAHEESIEAIACEYNIVPPNLPSQLFHQKFGFKEIGRQVIANGVKAVSMQVLRL